MSFHWPVLNFCTKLLITILSLSCEHHHCHFIFSKTCGNHKAYPLGNLTTERGIEFFTQMFTRLGVFCTVNQTKWQCKNTQ